MPCPELCCIPKLLVRQVITRHHGLQGMLITRRDSDELMGYLWQVSSPPQGQRSAASEEIPGQYPASKCIRSLANVSFSLCLQYIFSVGTTHFTSLDLERINILVKSHLIFVLVLAKTHKKNMDWWWPKRPLWHCNGIIRWQDRKGRYSVLTNIHIDITFLAPTGAKGVQMMSVRTSVRDIVQISTLEEFLRA